MTGMNRTLGEAQRILDGHNLELAKFGSHWSAFAVNIEAEGRGASPMEALAALLDKLEADKTAWRAAIRDEFECED